MKKTFKSTEPGFCNEIITVENTKMRVSVNSFNRNDNGCKVVQRVLWQEVDVDHPMFFYFCDNCDCHFATGWDELEQQWDDRCDYIVE